MDLALNNLHMICHKTKPNQNLKCFLSIVHKNINPHNICIYMCVHI